jgi:lysylphosphatidylglycerol synthetase-like protein (DUF2156 family)
VWAIVDHNPWVVEPLWGIAMIGYFAAAFGILRVPLLRGRWKETIVVATFASILLLLIFVSDLSLVGICLDTAILVIALVVQPLDATTSRLIVRARGPGSPSVRGLILGPFSVFVFEPAHFIMQRAMLCGIRDRAERSAKS